MRKIIEIAADLKNLLAGAFGTVRLSAATTPDQLLKELGAIGSHQLPAVVIIVDNGSYIDSTLTRELTAGVVVIDRFVAGADDRVISSWESVEKLQTFFPATGLEMNDVVCLPQRFYAVRGDTHLASYALELKIIQPSV